MRSFDDEILLNTTFIQFEKQMFELKKVEKEKNMIKTDIAYFDVDNFNADAGIIGNYKKKKKTREIPEEAETFDEFLDHFVEEIEIEP